MSSQRERACIPCTVGILTFNSGKNLKQAIEPLSSFCEIIVCDGGSTDETIDIAKNFGAKIIKQDTTFQRENGTISDYSGVRNQILENARYDWQLYIDSDEIPTKHLCDEISRIVNTPLEDLKHLVYYLPRKYFYQDKVIDASVTYPNLQLRFFNRNAVTMFTRPIHEKIRVKEGLSIGTLEEYELVPLRYSFEESVEKQKKYIQMEIDTSDTSSFSNVIYLCYRSYGKMFIYLYRFFIVIFFKKGNKLPWRQEFIKVWYHFKVGNGRLLKYLGRLSNLNNHKV